MTLTFTALAALVTIVDACTAHAFVSICCTAPPSVTLWSIGSFRFLTYVFGHVNWAHLAGNATFILLLGPLVEARYGSRHLAFMMTMTALATGVLNALLFDTGLLGASGIVFMLIALSSLTNIRGDGIPLTFMLVALIYGTSEVAHALRADGISQFAHLFGGICGACFGFLSDPAPSHQP